MTGLSSLDLAFLHFLTVPEAFFLHMLSFSQICLHPRFLGLGEQEEYAWVCAVVSAPPPSPSAANTTGSCLNVGTLWYSQFFTVRLDSHQEFGGSSEPSSLGRISDLVFRPQALWLWDSLSVCQSEFAPLRVNDTHGRCLADGPSHLVVTALCFSK